MTKRKIIVAAIALGFIAFLSIFLLKSKSKPSPVIPIIPTTPAGVPWQTYSNQDYGYLISYPPQWQVETWDIQKEAKLTQVPDGSIWQQTKLEGQPGKFEVLIWENKTRAPLRTWLSWFRHEDLDLKAVPEQENFEVGGIPAIRYTQTETARGKPLEYIFFQVEDKIYEFVQEKQVVVTDKPVAIDYDKMIASFRFLEDEVQVEPKAETVISLAKDDLAKKLGVNTKEIRLLSIEAVDWPDTSLGCPKEEMMYAQVITPGYRVTLEGRGKSYIYHSDYRRAVSCEK